MAGTANGGLMTSAISGHAVDAEDLNFQRAAENFDRLMSYVASLYCAGGSSSVSAYEAHELAVSVAYALGIVDTAPDEAARVLDVENPIALWNDALAKLDKRTDDALALLRDVIARMPPIRNVSLRDTLVSLSELRKRYDTRFAAHEVPCDIDYQLSVPVDPDLMGIDYIEAWLSQLLVEARWISQFTVDSCVTVLEQACPDYLGLHVNLYDLLRPHEEELTPIVAASESMTKHM